MKKIILTAMIFASVASLTTWAQQEPAKKSKKKAKVETAALKEDGIDPVCKMKVKKGSTITHTHEGVQYGFCNPMCKDNFVKSPEKYLKK
ncbi:MAG: YHS domain-containing protein [Bacteroidetes bacterium]|nr:YHS domain-containing protein [Bacteroidota bacterium]